MPVLFVRRRLVIVWCFSSTCHGGQLDSLLRKSQDTQSRSYLAVSRLCVVVRSSVRPTASQRTGGRAESSRSHCYVLHNGRPQLYFVWLSFSNRVILGGLWLIFRMKSYVPGSLLFVCCHPFICPSDSQPANERTRGEQPIALLLHNERNEWSIVWLKNYLNLTLQKLLLRRHMIDTQSHFYLAVSRLCVVLHPSDSSKVMWLAALHASIHLAQGDLK